MVQTQYIQELCGEVAANLGLKKLTLTIFFCWCEGHWLSMALSGLKTSAVKYFILSTVLVVYAHKFALMLRAIKALPNYQFRVDL